MKAFIRRMIDEHKEICARISEFEEFVYGDASKMLPPVEFGNCCIQLKAMKIYAETLGIRLLNQGVVIENGQYLLHVDSINIPRFDDEDNAQTPPSTSEDDGAGKEKDN